MYGKDESSFWMKFLNTCSTFIKIVGITVESPLSNGNRNTMRLLTKVLDVVSFENQPSSSAHA